MNLRAVEFHVLHEAAIQQAGIVLRDFAQQRRIVVRNQVLSIGDKQTGSFFTARVSGRFRRALAALATRQRPSSVRSRFDRADLHQLIAQSQQVPLEEARISRTMLRGRHHAGRGLEDELRVRRPYIARKPPAAPSRQTTVGFLANVKRIAQANAAADVMQCQIHVLAPHEIRELAEVRLAARKDGAVDRPVQIGAGPERVRPPRVREQIDLLDAGSARELNALMEFGDAPARENELAAVGEATLPILHPATCALHRPRAIHLRMRQLLLHPEPQQRGILIVIAGLFVDRKSAERVLRRTMPELGPVHPHAIRAVVHARHVIQVQHPQRRIGVHLEVQRLESLRRHSLDSFNAQCEMPLTACHSKQNLFRAIFAAGREPAIQPRGEFRQPHQGGVGCLQVEAQANIAHLEQFHAIRLAPTGGRPAFRVQSQSE